MRGIVVASTAAFLSVAQALAPPAGAQTMLFGPDLAQQGWKHWTFRGYAPTEYFATAATTLTVKSRRSSSILYRTLPQPLTGEASLTWRWRVDRPVPAVDLGRKPGDDRSLGLYVAFAEGTDGPVARLGDALGLPPRALIDRGRVLAYVWGGNAPIGRIFPSPHAPNRTFLVIRRPATAPNRVWLEERVDLARDFRAAFGTDPPPIAAIAIVADSDDTGTESDAFIADIRVIVR